VSDRIEGGEKIGILAAELMESIEEADVDQGLEATIGTVAVVVEHRRPAALPRRSRAAASGANVEGPE
jgi:hypothetical protein